jgi:hypothetical protein
MEKEAPMSRRGRYCVRKGGDEVGAEVEGAQRETKKV